MGVIVDGIKLSRCQTRYSALSVTRKVARIRMKIRCIIDTRGEGKHFPSDTCLCEEVAAKSLRRGEPYTAKRRVPCHIYSRDADTRVQTCILPPRTYM